MQCLMKRFWRAVQGVQGEKLGEGLVIGHPCGSFKRISCVKLTPLQKHEHRQVKRQNKQSQTHPGNSGSPVVINAYNSALSAEWGGCVALHFWEGVFNYFCVGHYSEKPSNFYLSFVFISLFL